MVQLYHLLIRQAQETLSCTEGRRQNWLLQQGLLREVNFARSSRRGISSTRTCTTAAEGGNAGGAQAPRALPASAGSRPLTLRNGPVTWGSLLLLMVTGAGLIVYYDSEKKRKIEDVRKDQSVGKAAIGGPFTLVNQEGKTVTPENFKGQWNLVYFGFTYCPDICPEELQKMATAIDLIEKNAKIVVRPIFISVDPERDTVEQVGEYVKEFHPRLVGLTGSSNAVREAARAYRVYYMKTEEEGNDYLVDHSIIMYLMDPDMNFVKFFGKNNTDKQLADGIVEEIKNWKS